jgi:hypothetical protein
LTRSYIGIGLAEVLDNLTNSKPDHRLSKVLHPASVGVQFEIALAVMYVHVGNFGGCSTSGTGDYIRYTSGSDDSSGWSHSRTRCFEILLCFSLSVAFFWHWELGLLFPGGKVFEVL